MASPKESKVIPVVDIFAGPGGLSEGFQAFGKNNGPVEFVGVLALEKDRVACDTLILRHFFHMFPAGKVPELYYRAVRGEVPLSALSELPQWNEACARVWNTELGSTDLSELHGRIARSLKGAKEWVLLGGPPCQAYSLIGRSRMVGIGHSARISGARLDALKQMQLSRFMNDRRHSLYLEYLRIVAVHQPAIFVMENVKGILSSKIKSGGGKVERVFPHILRDLSSPWSALCDDPQLGELENLRRGKKRKYRIYSFVADGPIGSTSDTDFLVKCEEFGVPQARHRVVLLGVREDYEDRPQVLQRNRMTSVRDAIGDAPRLRSGLSKQADSTAEWLSALRKCFPANQLKLLPGEHTRTIVKKVIDRKSAALKRGGIFIAHRGTRRRSKNALTSWVHDPRIKGVIQHESRSHMQTDLGRYLFSSAASLKSRRSPRLPEWPEFLLPKHRNAIRRYDGAAQDSETFIDRFKVQIWDKPSSTITSHIAKDGHYYIHPDPFQCRSLSVREAARLQTFPDNYFFCGNRTQQYQQVGNAVPPLIAFQMARVISNFLAQR